MIVLLILLLIFVSWSIVHINHGLKTPEIKQGLDDIKN